MPFACAAVIGIAIIWLLYLTAIQLVSGPRCDKSQSNKHKHLPVPPRSLSGNGAWPVLGHTLLFLKFGGDMVTLFPPTLREWRCWPWSRKIGDCYSVFVLGQWRIVVNGSERARQLLEQTEVTEGWAWSSTPKTLLGKTCLPLWDRTQQEEADTLCRMIDAPLRHSSVVRFAPAFAELASQSIEQIMDGQFNVEAPEKTECEEMKVDEKVTWKALRSYTFDLINGPVLHLAKYSGPQRNRSSIKTLDELEHSISFEDDEVPSADSKKGGKGREVTREMLILWMGRLKAGLVDVKVTYGPEWMHVWRLNFYGRALNARKYLNIVIGSHVEERQRLIPVLRDQGRPIRDPFSSPLPLVAFTEDLIRGDDSVTGGNRLSKVSQNRSRTFSEPEFPPNDETLTSCPDFSTTSTGRERRARANTEPQHIVEGIPLLCELEQANPRKKDTRPMALIDQFLRREDRHGNGMTQVAITEISLLLWMSLDAGQAWTAMALNLLASDKDACKSVQLELEYLENTYGKDRLFTSFILSKMKSLDALIYEAIRLCPPFLGGLKVVKETVEVGGFQIPKNSNVIFCNGDQADFDLEAAKGKRPEKLKYPSVEVHGFLPLQGLELPIMVLQTKVFLAVLLRDYSPAISKKRTFLRRVHMALGKSLTGQQTPSGDVSSPCSSLSSSDMSAFQLTNGMDGRIATSKSTDTWDCGDLEHGDGGMSLPPNRSQVVSEGDLEVLRSHRQDDPQRLLEESQSFSNLPFPKPKRVTHIRPRRTAQIS